MCTYCRDGVDGLSGMVLSVEGMPAVSATEYTAAGSGSQPVSGAAVSPDSRWMPGRPAITRMGALVACLGPTPYAGQVRDPHATALTCAGLWTEHACAHALVRLPVHICISERDGMVSHTSSAQARTVDDSDALMQRFPGPLTPHTPRDKVCNPTKAKMYPAQCCSSTPPPAMCKA